MQKKRKIKKISKIKVFLLEKILNNLIFYKNIMQISFEKKQKSVQISINF